LLIISTNTQPDSNLLNNVYIYDQSNAVIVKNNGNIIYSTNWTDNNWNNIPFNALNSSGIGNNLTNYDLKTIYMKDINTFIITKIDNGTSQILNCYFPVIFNNTNNFVLDVSGNMTITGNIKFDGSGNNLSSNNNTFYLLNNENINKIYFGGNSTLTTMYGNTNIQKLYCNIFSSISGDDTNFFNNPSYKGNIYLGNKNTKIFLTDTDGSSNNIQNVVTDVVKTNETTTKIYARLQELKIVVDDGLSDVLYANNFKENYISLNYNINNINNYYQSSTVNIVEPNASNPINSYTRRNLPSIYNISRKLTNVFGGGIYIQDSSILNDSSDGYMLISSNANGYYFKAPASYNVVNLNIGNLTLPTISENKFNIINPINNGILVLSNNYSNLKDSANYSIEVNPIDISNILLRDANSTPTYQNILTNIGISGDLTVSLNNRLFVYGDVSINNNLYVRNNIKINTSNTNYNLDVSGNINFNGILNPVTLIDNSVLLTNTPTLDYSNKFCNNLINTNTNINNYNNTVITISANGMFQYIYSGIYLYNSYNYGISWANIPYNPEAILIQTIIKTTSDGSIIYIGNKNEKNLFFSNDYGNTWIKTKDINIGSVYNLLNFSISSNGKLIILLCYYRNIDYYVYFFYSDDYGNNFNQNYYIDLTIYNSINSINQINNSIINMSSSGQYQIFYLTNTIISNIYISNDYGLNWNTINNISSNNISSISSISISSSGKYIAIGTILNKTISTSIKSPLYFSSDYGNTFNDYSSKIPYSPNNWNIINMSANGQYIIGIDSNYNKILTSINYGNTWNYIDTPYSIVSSEMSANGQYITLIDSLGNIYYSVTPYINISISNNLIVNNDMSLNGRAFINSPVIQF
jgi:hypothetical protein